MAKPLVSAIIIFWNAKRFLQEAIRSVLAQSYDNWELLLVDDGSTDGSRAIAEREVERAGEKLRLVQHGGGENRGMSASRNLGWREARGAYIGFLDADDIWLPDKLQHQVADLETHPEAAMTYGPTQYWFSWTGLPQDAGRDSIPGTGIPAGAVLEPPALLTKCYPLGPAPSAATCAILVRREMLALTGGFEEAFRGLYEDQAFLVKMYLRGKVHVSDQCLSRYRMHADSCVSIALRSARHQTARRVFLNWLESYLKTESVTDRAIWRAFRAASWPVRHPLLHRVGTEWSEAAANVRRRCEAAAVRVSRNSPASITAHPNPVVLPPGSSNRFPVGATTIEWTAESSVATEVHVDAPDGPLLSRTAGGGKIATGNWVHDGMAFYLQDVTRGKGLTRKNTLALTTVRVTQMKRARGSRVGQVRFGDLRRLTPISLEWGFDRGLPIDRYYIEIFLEKYAEGVRGRTLEVGNDAYTRLYGGERVIHADVLNPGERPNGAAITADLADAPQIPPDTFDCIILTQTLQYIYESQAAIRTLRRILKPGGVVLATVPGITQTYTPRPQDWYWRFTAASAARLFEEQFGPDAVTVETFGNVLTATAFLQGLAAAELTKDELEYHDESYEVVLAVRAVKPVGASGEGSAAGDAD